MLKGFSAIIGFVGVGIGAVGAAELGLAPSAWIVGVAMVLLIALMVFVATLVISAASALVSATLDTAVSTSCVLTDVQRREALGVPNAN